MKLMELSQELAGLVEAVGRSVVRLERGARPVSGSVVSGEGHVVAISHTVERDEDVELGLPDGAALGAIGRATLTILDNETAPPSLFQFDGTQVTVDESAIPWLKLEATLTMSGYDGERLTGTAWIQRINTRGGIAPAASDCDEDDFGTMVDVPYTADYVFWKRTGG